MLMSPHTNTQFELPSIPDDGQLDVPSRKPNKHTHQLKQWITQHKKMAIIIAVIGALLLAGGGTALYLALKPKPHAATPAPVAKVTPPSAPQAPKYYSPLTGLPVPDEATTKRQVTAVMIENSPAARPQSGILTSGVVFEAIA